jgi:MFS family permease
MLAGYLHDVYIGTASAFFLLLLLASFFSNASFSVVFPYMAELWPAKLRASGFGLVYGCSNIAKFIGPAGLAVIAGASNYVAPQATLNALVPAFNYFAAWYLLAVSVFYSSASKRAAGRSRNSTPRSPGRCPSKRWPGKERAAPAPESRRQEPD